MPNLRGPPRISLLPRRASQPCRRPAPSSRTPTPTPMRTNVGGGRRHRPRRAPPTATPTQPIPASCRTRTVARLIADLQSEQRIGNQRPANRVLDSDILVLDRGNGRTADTGTESNGGRKAAHPHRMCQPGVVVIESRVESLSARSPRASAASGNASVDRNDRRPPVTCRPGDRAHSLYRRKQHRAPRKRCRAAAWVAPSANTESRSNTTRSGCVEQFVAPAGDGT